MSKPTLTATSGGAARPDAAAIAKRAYELSLQRGSAPGHEMDDWLQAEAELLAAMAPPAASDEDRDPREPAAAVDRAAPDVGVRRSRERSGSRRAVRQPQSQ